MSPYRAATPPPDPPPMHIVTKLMFLALRTAVLVESMVVVGTMYHVPEVLFVVPGLLTAILAVLGFLRITNSE